MGAAETIPAAVAQLYEGVLDPALWPSALQTVTDLMKADHAIALVQRSDSRNVEFVTAARVDMQRLNVFTSAMEQGTAAQFFAGMPSRSVLSSTISLPELPRSDFYHDIIRPMNGHHAAFFFSPLTQQTVGSCVICRPPQMGDYDLPELECMRLLAPHIESALRLRQRLAQAEAEVRQSLHVLNHMDLGVVLLERSGLPHFVNRYAETLLQERDGLVCDRTGISAATAGATRQLRQLIAIAAQPEKYAGAQSLRLCLPRPSMRRPLVIRVMPLSRAAAETFGSAAAEIIVFIHDPHRAGHSDEPILMAAFGLTEREADVAALLAQGCDLAMIAEVLSISIGTVRSHLKHVFSKTGTSRQGELIRLVLTLCR
jgi:DNA-binding CsgD family transcriptional regulator